MGKLIVLDGLDGSGKSTQLEAVDRWMTAQEIPHKIISFPDYEQPSSVLVRQYLAGEFGGTPAAVNAYAASSFYAVDRYASFKRFWQEEYENGTVILAARYTTSNAIHQMSKLPKEEWDKLTTPCQLVGRQDFPVRFPLTILLKKRSISTTIKRR